MGTKAMRVSRTESEQYNTSIDVHEGWSNKLEATMQNLLGVITNVLRKMKKSVMSRDVKHP